MQFNVFVLPFCIGALILFSILGYTFYKWTIKLKKEDRILLFKSFFSLKPFVSIKEIILESLLHRKIFKVNPVLGYMHSSLAFGWFLLIIFGALEAKFISGGHFNLPYYPIFLKFFERDNSIIPHAALFEFLMDFLLLYVLSGLLLAILKRFNSKIFGIKKTTKLKSGDKIALASLWLIFPLRLLAESFTAGVFYNGGFLTGTLGNLLAKFLPIDILIYPTWWAYSLALGIFFVSLPFSRYMHIFSEIFLIFARNAGLKQDKDLDSYAQMQIFSCSRCGICIDTCQMNKDLDIKDMQSVYFIQDARNKEDDNKKIFNCLMCGRCDIICPVGIDINKLRIAKRIENHNINNESFNYINQKAIKQADIAYFAGCMTHLTPSIHKAFTNILDKTSINYTFVDKDGSICCGRPSLLAGKINDANVLKEKNIEIIKNTGAKTLVTSCPICYKTFSEDYNLNIRILHHSQYLAELIDNKIINPKSKSEKVYYHDPCELGRGMGVYKEPRKLIQSVSQLQNTQYNEANSLCCGGSLANIQISQHNREKISNNTLINMEVTKDSTVVTACPLCKKTLQRSNNQTIIDIAELVNANLE